MPSGYIILNINVLNPENYKEYLEKAPPTAQKFGGEYIIRGCLLYTSDAADE